MRGILSMISNRRVIRITRITLVIATWLTLGSVIVLSDMGHSSAVWTILGAGGFIAAVVSLPPQSYAMFMRLKSGRDETVSKRREM